MVQDFFKNKKITVGILAFCLLVLVILREHIVFLLLLAIIMFDKCFFARINVIGGIEFVTISVMIVTLKYGLITGFVFCTFIAVLPGIVNTIIGYRWVASPSFKSFSFSIGNIRDYLSVVIIDLLKNTNLYIIMLALLLFKNFFKPEGIQPMDYITIPINFLFNLSIVFFFYDFWIYLINF